MTKPPDEAGPESNPASSEPAYIGTERAWKLKHLPPGGGDGGSWPLDARVAKLEAHAEHMQGDLIEIKGLLGALGGQLQHLPSKQDMLVNIAAMVAIGLAVIGLTVGGIIGGLSWIQDRGPPPANAPSPAPMIFQLPAQPQAAPQSVKPTTPVAPPKS